MTEKIGLIKNPLTIIAIFAGIAEVSGTIVLPFVAENNQTIFIYFLITFPTILVVVFFLTLNFNNKVLYAPSDYSNEENYFRGFKYDSSKQEQVKLVDEKEDKTQILYAQFMELSQNLHTKIQIMERRLAKSETESEINEDNLIYSFEISDIPRANEFISLMNQKGFPFKLYKSPSYRNNPESTKLLKEHKTIWLGKNIPIEISKAVIIEAKKFYPHLQYIHISGDLNEDAPFEIYDQIFIGGSTSTAANTYKLKPIPSEGFVKIQEYNSIDDLFQFIRTFYP
jgi:hypothetical protein